MPILRLFGGLVVELDGGRVLTGRAAHRKRLAMLALLARSPDQRLSRDKLAAYLWPEIGAERARHQVATALYDLRKALGRQAIRSAGDDLRLDPAALPADVLEFEAALARDDPERAVELYRGPFLDGFFLSDALEFERWVDRARRRSARAWAGALETVAERRAADGDVTGAAEAWRLRAAADPLDSRVALRLMEALDAAGDRAAAIRHAQSHAALLKDELGAEPDPDVAALAERLREGPVQRVPPARGDAERDATAVAAAPERTGAGRPTLRDTQSRRARPEVRRGKARRGNAHRGKLLALAGIVLTVGGYMALRTAGAAPFDAVVTSGANEPATRIVLADLENHTTDSTLAVAVTEALRADLSQSPVVRPAEPGYVDFVLERMERDRSGTLDEATAREVAAREGLPAVITGEVSEAGDGYLLLARIVVPSSGSVLASHRESAVGASEVIPAIDRLSAALRREIGESLSTVRAGDPLQAVTTASLDALRAYSQGVRAHSRGADPSRTLGLFDEAIRLDSTFAAAYRARGVTYASMNERTSAMMADITAAHELAERLPSRERHMAAGTVHRYVTGDREAARAAYRRALDIDPEFGAAYDQLGRLAFFDFRDWAEAERLFRRSIEVRPYPSYVPYVNLSRSQFNQGHFDDARETLDALRDALPGFRHRDRHLADFSAARGDYDAARTHLRALLERTRGSAYWRRIARTNLGRLAHLRGRLADAERRFDEALRGARRERAGSEYLLAAIRSATVPLWFRGDTAQALARLDSLRRAVPLDSLDPLDRPYLPLAGFYSYAGRPGEARTLIQDWERTVPVGRRRVVEGISRAERAALALAEHRVRDAIRQLRRAENRYVRPLTVYPQLGRAYELASRPDSAVAVYERYLSTPYYLRAFGGTSPSGGGDWHWLPLVHERLAALYAARGETARAAEHHRALIRLWRHADPELRPRVEAARRAVKHVR